MASESGRSGESVTWISAAVRATTRSRARRVCAQLALTSGLALAFGGLLTSSASAALEMNPIDSGDRIGELRDSCGIGYCNITKCCTKVCPEEIKITDNAIIPLKERVVDRFYDPITRLFRIFG